MKRCLCVSMLLLSVVWIAAGQEPSWQPSLPTPRDAVEVHLEMAEEGDTLHWGVVVDGDSWVRPIPGYRPEGSTLYGNAVRTPFRDGRVTIGPFDDPNQVVTAVIFALLRADGSWDNNEGEDYEIPVSLGRISFYPESPTLHDTIEVIVHDSQPGGNLRWGANVERGTWQPLNSVYWPIDSSMASDGVGLNTPLPDPDEEGVSTLRIGPFHHGEQVIRSLHFAVNWGDEWDTDGGRNYNIEVDWRDESHPEPIRIVYPAESHIAGEELEVVAEAPHLDRLEFWLSGRRLGAVSGPPFARTLDLSRLPYGPYEVVARSVGEEAVQLDAVTFWHVPSTDTKPLPEGIGFGATDHGDGTVTFALHAPGKRFVSLVGDFNCWDPDTDRMHLSPEGTWWITRALEAGTWRYQYYIDGERGLGDPYAREVDWTHDRGEKGWMPKHARTVLRLGEPPFEWTATDYQRPRLDELVVYELYIEDFVPGEGFLGMIEKLDYIRDLGFNAIEPLPWHPWPGHESWGYNPAFHFAVEQLYGTPNELKRLIDEAHQRGMAVIIDMVLNHMEWGSPLYQLYGRDYEASPFFREYHGHNWGFPKIDQQSPAVKRYVADVIRFWIEEYRIDGFRYDATRWTGWSGYNDWGASWYAYVARQADPDNLQIAEHLPIEPELIIETEMDTGWHAEYRWRIREMINSATLNPEALASNLDGRTVGFEDSLQRMPYTESHDEERVVRELREAGFDEAEVFRRAAMAIALPLTTPGVPMIYAGQEFGEDTLKNVGWNPLNWHYLELAPNRELHRITRNLVHMRVAHPALRSDNVVIHANDGETGLAIFERDSSPANVIVALNFGRDPVEATIELHDAADWIAVLPDEQVDSGEQSVRLLPGEVMVWATAWPGARPDDLEAEPAAPAVEPEAVHETEAPVEMGRTQCEEMEERRSVLWS